MYRATRILLALVLTLAVAAPAAQAQPKKPKKVNVTVMTRNIYLGGNIFHPIGSPDLDTFKQRTSELWAEVQKTDFVGTRAALLAREVKRAKPDLVGLQEVAIWRRSPDGQSDGNTTPATQVVYDFLKSLRRELARQGLKYSVGVVQREADIEAPLREGYDVRLTMHDVILVKKRPDLKITKRLSKNYKADIGVPTPAGTLTSNRGWTAVDGKLKGKKFRFVNTHLEAAAAAPRNAQAAELIARGGPLRVKGKPVIVVRRLQLRPAGQRVRRRCRERPQELQAGGPVAAPPRRRPGLLLLPGQLGHVRHDAGRVRPSDRPDLLEARSAGPEGQGRGQEPVGPHGERPLAVRPRRRGADAPPEVAKR